MNQVTLLGHLTRDPEFYYSQNGTAVAKTAIAVNNRRDGSTMFVDLVFFAGLGENVNKYLNKGDKICVHGRLDLSKWVDQQGQNRQKHSVIVADLEMLGTPKGAQTQTKPIPTKDFKLPDANVSIEDFNEDEIPF